MITLELILPDQKNVLDCIWSINFMILEDNMPIVQLLAQY